MHAGTHPAEAPTNSFSKIFLLRHKEGPPKWLMRMLEEGGWGQGEGKEKILPE
jgi:hypothetical protein